MGCGAAGSELCLAIDAAKKIEESGKKARVVSAVCWELFEDQDDSYKKSVLPDDVTARVSFSAIPLCLQAASCLLGCSGVLREHLCVLRWECQHLNAPPAASLSP